MQLSVVITRLFWLLFTFIYHSDVDIAVVVMGTNLMYLFTPWTLGTYIRSRCWISGHVSGLTRDSCRHSEGGGKRGGGGGLSKQQGLNFFLVSSNWKSRCGEMSYKRNMSIDTWVSGTVFHSTVLEKRLKHMTTMIVIMWIRL